nr:MAG TPA: hypothetical protein [Caudoviricetes sp.]DAV07137.1 MAG TPA: hypothetical protein [Caudoviricetes sp.]
MIYLISFYSHLNLLYNNSLINHMFCLKIINYLLNTIYSFT